MTKEQNRQFLNQLAVGPDEIDFYFSTELPEVVLQEIAAKHGLDRENLDDLLANLVIGNFNLSALQQKINLLVTNSQTARKVFLDIVGKICLPLDAYLLDDVAGFIAAQGGRPEEYRSYVEDFQKRLADHTGRLLDELLDEADEQIDFGEEKEAVLDIVSNHLVEVLYSDNSEAVLSFDRGLAYVINNEESLIKEMENILLNSAEQLTKEPLVIGNKQAEPTIANWLSDFISLMGLASFDSLVVANYMVKSANAQRLQGSERDALQKLLLFYLNLKFYPASLEDRPATEWYIMPLSLTEKPMSSRASSAPRVDMVKPELEFSRPEYVQAKLTSLQKMADNYPVGSLERLAVEEEIKKIKK